MIEGARSPGRASPRKPSPRRGETTFARALLTVALGALPLSLTRTACAQLGPDGSRIQTNDYAIDLFQGPVLASTRVMGLGGAYVAVGDFIEGNTQNAAAPAVRSAHALDYVDWDLGFGITFPSSLGGSDFFNTGKGRTTIPTTAEQSFVSLELAGNLQFGPWGIGAAVNTQQYALTRAEASGDRLQSQIVNLNVQLARSFLDGQLFVGLGVRTIGLSVLNTNAVTQAERTLFESVGGNVEVGTLWRPNGAAFRIGAAFRGPVESQVDTETTTAQVLFPGTPEELYLPNSVRLPWQISMGFAYQFGRLFNPRWYDPHSLIERTDRYVRWRQSDRERRRERLHANAERAGGDVPAAKAAIDAHLDLERAIDERSLEEAANVTRQRLRERYRDLGRFYVLVSTALHIDGPVGDAVGIESFLEREVNRSGQRTTFSPRLGIESEIIPNWVVLRGGTYLEPTRFESNPAGARIHGTGGADIKLGQWDVFGIWPDHYTWRLRGAVDAARDYFGWGLALGGWY
ncbi:MAG: hypothetical protein GX607_04120 [Myxococcales bacterium]|jgi:hypothetical protein|nr:hypothetical protein [Myxococcales bacterium]